MFIILSLAACSHTPNYNTNSLGAEALTEAIQSISKSINIYEAEAVSSVLISSTKELAVEYKMASPPRYHNLLVQLKLRDRGLCCHWAQDLLERVIDLEPQTLDVDWLVTKHGQLLEHNSIVIFAVNSSWQQGLVYDPWRKSGNPYWTPVKDDSFKWTRHPLSGDWKNLRCQM